MAVISYIRQNQRPLLNSWWNCSINCLTALKASWWTVHWGVVAQPKMWAGLAVSGLEIKPLIHEENSKCSNKTWVFFRLFEWKSYEATSQDLPEWSQWCRRREEEEAVPSPLILGNLKLEVLLVGILMFCQRGGFL